MPHAMQFLLWALVAVPVAGEAAPMQKVIAALAKMRATSEEEMQEEKIKFAKFDQFCSSTLDVKKKAIQQTTETLESIASEISMLESEAEKMTMEIKKHEEATKNSQEQQSNATDLRKAEEEDFKATHLDLQESVAAIQKALQQLKKEDKDRPQSAKASFVQSGLVGLERSEAVAKALALAGAFRNKPVPPKADAYEFKSGGIIEVLKDLEGQFKKQISEVESAETKKKHSHEMLLASLANEIKVNQKAKEKKLSFKDSALSRKAEAEAKKSDVTADLEADQKYRDDLSVECKVKGSDFAERQHVRSDEIQAMKQAIEILKNPGSFIQTPRLAKASSLALLRSEGKRSPSLSQAMQFLQRRAEELHSQNLRTLLVRLQEVPNVAVENIVKMLKEKLEKLQTEDVDDSTQKAWCKEELSENGEARETKNDEAGGWRILEWFDMSWYVGLVTSVYIVVQQSISKHHGNLKPHFEGKQAKVVFSVHILQYSTWTLLCIVVVVVSSLFALSRIFTENSLPDLQSLRWKVENLKAEIKRLQSSLVQRSEQNEKLADDMTNLDKSIEEATALRNEEKASNLKSLKETTEGKEALSAAMDVLQTFYQSLSLVQKSARTKHSLVRDGREIKPEFSAGGYSGQSGQNSIIALLQKVAADYAKEASDLQAAEDAAASEFKQFVGNTKSEKKKKEISQRHNTMSMTSEKASLEQRKKDLGSTEKQLDAALEYYEARDGGDAVLERWSCYLML